MITKATIIRASRQDMASMLDNTNWTHEFSWQQLLILGDYFQLCSMPAHGLIYDEGDTGDSLGILIKGCAQVCKGNNVLTTLRPGRTFGEMSLLDHQCRSANVTALEDCHFLSISRANFEKLSNEHPALALKMVIKIAKLLSQALRLTSGQLCEFLES
ncbi:MAG: cyclic nucleotide-binding domain-containing protein [Methylovulum sp.]|nr:MAG: cyclic nucleotide-binding domain-containing protein [Methylovulum sp.]